MTCPQRTRSHPKPPNPTVSSIWTQIRKAKNPSRIVAVRQVVSAAPPVEEATAPALPVLLPADLVLDAELLLPVAVDVALDEAFVVVDDVVLFEPTKLAHVMRVLFA